MRVALQLLFCSLDLFRFYIVPPSELLDVVIGSASFFLCFSNGRFGRNRRCSLVKEASVGLHRLMRRH